MIRARTSHCESRLVSTKRGHPNALEETEIHWGAEVQNHVVSSGTSEDYDLPKRSHAEIRHPAAKQLRDVSPDREAPLVNCEISAMPCDVRGKTRMRRDGRRAKRTNFVKRILAAARRDITSSSRICSVGSPAQN